MQTRAVTVYRRASGSWLRLGFTLVELLVTISIVAILAALAFPSYREFSTNMAVSDNANGLVGALNTARSEAVKRGRAAAVIANNGDWNNGWQIVVARETAVGVVQDTPTSPGPAASDCVGYLDNAVTTTSTVPLCLQHRDALTGGYTILGANDDGAAGQVVFDPTGALRDTNAFDFSVCRPADRADPKKSRRVHVVASGTIESRRDTTGLAAGDCS